MFSYGLSEAELDQLDFEELTDWLLNHVPRAHVDFLDGFEDMVEIGDYAFVHAGIKPGVPLAEQKPEDLRWIRDEFLSSRKSHEGKIVVHGHTIMLEVDEHPNRIGIDTGAYHSGRLRSEEHTSELQSLMRISYAVFCLKKKKSTTHVNKPYS